MQIHSVVFALRRQAKVCGNN